jgi:hypothetical protein
MNTNEAATLQIEGHKIIPVNCPDAPTRQALAEKRLCEIEQRLTEIKEEKTMLNRHKHLLTRWLAQLPKLTLSARV